MSNACVSGSSSEALPSAALIPPSAAPEWLRVGWIFEIIATSAPASNASMAARMPAQPAPTTSTSCFASTGLGRYRIDGAKRLVSTARPNGCSRSHDCDRETSCTAHASSGGARRGVGRMPGTSRSARGRSTSAREPRRVRPARAPRARRSWRAGAAASLTRPRPAGSRAPSTTADPARAQRRRRGIRRSTRAARPLRGARARPRPGRSFGRQATMATARSRDAAR